MQETRLMDKAMGLYDFAGFWNDSRDFLKSINTVISKEPELQFDECRLSSIPPYRFAFSAADRPATFFSHDNTNGTYNYQRLIDRKVGYAGSCRLCMSIRNVGNHVASIRSIIINKDPLTKQFADWSLLFTPEGGLSGEPWRFYCNLEDSPQRLRQCYQERGEFIPCGNTDYFECGRIEIEPEHTADIVLVLEATCQMYECTILVRAESPKAGTYIIAPTKQPEITLIPMPMIPREKRLWYNFSFDEIPCSLEEGDYRVMF